MPAKKEEKITVEAELTVSYGDTKEIIRTFDKAWHRALELPMPVRVSFNSFVRKENVK